MVLILHLHNSPQIRICSAVTLPLSMFVFVGKLGIVLIVVFV